MRCEVKLAKREAIGWNAYAEQVQQLMRCEAKLAKLEVINWIFTQNKFSNLMRCEAKLAKREAIGWNSYAEQVQLLDALWGKNWKSRGY